MTEPALKVLDEARARTNLNQADAANPDFSAWVSANAGTGKTHVLVLRVLRLLLVGTPPDRILCLTYTKAAAAEMSNRLFERLSEWATIDDARLSEALQKLLDRAAGPDEMVNARQLFARAIETPGGLKVQTIHAFCERVLQRFPLEAGIAPNFTILDEEQTGTLVRDCIDRVLGRGAMGDEPELAQALNIVTTHAISDRFDTILSEALRARDGLTEAVNIEPEQLRAQLTEKFNIENGTNDAELAEKLSTILSENDLREARDILSAGKKTDQKRAELLSRISATSDTGRRAELIASLFLTQQHQPRSSLMTADLKAANTAIHDTLLDAREKVYSLQQDRIALSIIDATCALIEIARHVIETYRTQKNLRSTLDYDDLLEFAARLLADSDAAQWVLFKLDNGIDHILVDEAQDTSPNAWAVIENIADEFFAGLGQKEITRTIFAVGDEKQSIYSFQGAEPTLFATRGQKYAGMAEELGQDWKNIPLNLSFRTIHPILSAVDALFLESNLFGIEATPGRHMPHIAHRAGTGGLVEIWETEKHDDSGERDVWDPLSEQTERQPHIRLAERIAEKIGHWLETGEELSSENRPIDAGDILILLRKRQPMAQPLIRALKDRGIPVAGTDRIRVTDQIAVQDLMALGDFLLLPEDDLALASVLKSPLFSLDDDDLFEICTRRKGSLWSVLFEVGRKNERFTEAAETLARWRRQADFLPPYEFFARILERDGGRKRMLARLGPESGDVIDEFLNLAIRYDDEAPPSMQGFLDWLRASNPEIRRDMEQGRNEVRVMTVHGAKGLEAPIVFLADTCSTRSGGDQIGISSIGLEGWEAELPLWKISDAKYHDTIDDLKSEESRKDREEYYRLLYVAMTRARDRLYIGGFEKKTGRDKNCWYDIIDEKLRPGFEESHDEKGQTVYRHDAPQLQDATKVSLEHTAHDIQPLPDWANTRIPYNQQRVIPLAPSQIAPVETEAANWGDEVEMLRDANDRETEPEGITTDQTIVSPKILSQGNRFKRGLITHALLQYLPDIEAEARAAAAEKFVEIRGHDLSANVRASIISETLAILQDVTFGALFSKESQAEVSIAALIPPPDGHGPDLKITGQIDRLAENAGEIFIVDYKTNRPPPGEVDQVGDAYLLQLAAYRLAVRKIYAGEKKIHAALLWTHGPHLMDIPPAILDKYEDLLWNVDGHRLLLTEGHGLPTFP